MNTSKNNKSFYIVFGIIVYLITVLFSIHLHIVSANHPADTFTMISDGMDHFIQNPINIFPINSNSFEYLGNISIIYLFALLLAYVNEERNRHFDSNKTNGTSRWNTDFKSYNKKYRDMTYEKKESDKDSLKEKDENQEHKKVLDYRIDKNMILSRDVFLNMDTFKTRRNNNVIVFGGSGTGKSRFLVKPNALQSNSSFVFTDPSGEILRDVGGFLEKQGYKIKIFNLVQMEKSNCYNPFEYIRDEAGVLSLVNCLIQNTTEANASKGDPFWEKSEMALLMALIYYLVMERPKEEQNFSSILKLLRSAEINEMDPNAKSSLDRVFEQLEKKDKDHIAVRQYNIFKLAGAKTAKSILITTAVRLSAFNIQSVADLTSKDNLELGNIGDEKTALFVIIPTADTTYNFLVSLMYSQLFDTLYYHAENECPNGRLKHHLRLILDEFANIGNIPGFEKKLATMRKYEISCTIILQSISQLKSMYEKDWSGIIANCDTTVFLGGKDPETNKGISDDLGDATIVIRNCSRSRGKSSNSSLSFNRAARKLMDPAEIQKLPDDECIVFVRGLQPFKGKKYDYKKHRNYKYTGDANPKNQYKNLLNNTKPVNFREIDAEEELKKSQRYTEAIEHPKEPGKQIIGKPRKIKEGMEAMKNDTFAVLEANPSMTPKIEESETEIWDMGDF